MPKENIDRKIETVTFRQTVTKDAYQLLSKIKKSRGAKSEQEIVRAALAFFFEANGYKIV